MKKRTLGINGPQLTEIGFGAWAIGGPWEYGWGSVEDSESVKAIRKALDCGINWIDTAAVYGLGHSEEVVARALKGIRQTVFIATKCGRVWDLEKKVRIHASPESIRREIEKSLKRLNTDHIDLYQIHWPRPEEDIEQAFARRDCHNAGELPEVKFKHFALDFIARGEVVFAEPRGDGSRKKTAHKNAEYDERQPQRACLMTAVIQPHPLAACKGKGGLKNQPEGALPVPDERHKESQG
jgi:hypothetical protein